MELITLSLIAASAALGSLLAARTVVRRRSRDQSGQRPESADENTPVPVDPCEGMAAGLDHMLQFGQATRWPRHGILVHHDGRRHCAILMTRDKEDEQATVVMAPPAPSLYWLERRDVATPVKPPTRLEIDGLLLDRVISFPARLEAIGDDPPAVGDSGVFGLYEGSVGDAAVVLVADQTYVWYGSRLSDGDWDDLGEVDPKMIG
jgi:hypothetical protein